MRYYTVHTPPEDSAPERLVFIKDGFSWPALFFPLLFALWHRMWLTLVYVIVFVLAIAWAGRLGGEDLATWLAILGCVLFAFEANGIRRMSLESRGWEDAGGAFGKNIDEAEARFFGSTAQQVETAPRREAIARAAYSPKARDHGADEPILGLFPEPER